MSVETITFWFYILMIEGKINDFHRSRIPETVFTNSILKTSKSHGCSQPNRNRKLPRDLTRKKPKALPTTNTKLQDITFHRKHPFRKSQIYQVTTFAPN